MSAIRVPAVGAAPSFRIETENEVFEGVAEEVLLRHDLDAYGDEIVAFRITPAPGYTMTQKRRGEKITDLSEVRVGDVVDLYHPGQPALYKGGGRFIGARVTETVHGGFAVDSGTPSSFVAPLHLNGGGVEVYLVEKAPRHPDPKTAKVIRIDKSTDYPYMTEPVIAVSNGEDGYYDTDGDHYSDVSIAEWVEYDLTERGAEPEVKLEDLGYGDVIRVFELETSADDPRVLEPGVRYTHDGDNYLYWARGTEASLSGAPFYLNNEVITKWELVSRAEENA